MAGSNLEEIYIDSLPDRVCSALETLLEGHQYAEQSGSDYWEFSVDALELKAHGLNKRDFRWLACMELVNVAESRGLGRDVRNREEFCSSVNLTEGTTFILTEVGAALARRAVGQGRTDGRMMGPQWDGLRRELRVNGRLVKRFKLPSPNQECIIRTFHEEGWPLRIDDPLPPKSDQDPKKRLNETIKSLNRHHVRKLIRFHGDGTGEGICWEVT